jgi:protoheme IX farnesyltransferase
MVSGAVVTMTQAQSVCAAWPLCPGGIIPSDPLGWVQLFHRLFVGLSAVVITKTTWVVWQTQREHVLLLVSATAATMLFYAQGFIGALQVTRSDPAFLGSLHSITTAVMWAMLTLMVVSVGFLSTTQSRVSVSPLSAPERKQRRRDFLALTKPIVVLLLLMTTYGGMVVSGKAWPSLSLTVWTLLGGALAAGGSSAINQYIDRNRDRLMVRTAKRPIAAGRLTPAEGLAFGVALCLISFYLLAGFVNLTAAFLAVIGMVYYVVLYSILLKNATVQNIVIGGGAGAIPPLVGWAAVSGGISVAAFTLFVVIFFWTPPHFWALALVRRKDYQRAGVPMLPVVRGERETRLQIFLYTLGLVAITLTLPFFGVGNAIYWVSAAILGLALIHVAWKVWQRGGNKLAWKMYRYSSMYLAFLFLALMIDAVL